MIDIHAHLLPGIDDGPRNWDEALAIVRLARDNGVTAMAATPHMYARGEWANERGDVLPLVDELRRRVQDAGIAVDIVAGGEVQLTPDLRKRIEENRVLTYGDARQYLLLEMPWTGVPPGVDEVIFQLRLQGIVPIMAHPERFDEVQRRPALALEWVEHGALLQVNVGSLRRGGATEATALALLDRGAVHFIASDAHGVGRRPPLTPEDAALVRQLVGEEGARRLLQDNPAAVLAGGKVSAEDAAPGRGPGRDDGRQRRSWLGRWRHPRGKRP